MTAMLGKVLIVEDEPRIRRFVRDALGREGCETFEAGNVGDGLELAGAQHPDMIVLDLGLPDQSGLELIRNLRTWSSIPILILSARIAEQDKRVVQLVGNKLGALLPALDQLDFIAFFE